MPIYEYGCSQCNKTSEHLLKISDPHPKECPHCHSANTLTKKVSKTSFILKGGGWYTDAYSDKGKSTKSDSSTTKSESKVEATPSTSTASEDKK